MLSQGQFFGPDEYKVHPDKMDFNQFTQAADYYHGTVSYNGPRVLREQANDWDETQSETHAGTLQAAQERIGSMSASDKAILPLRHVGKYREGPPIPDQGTSWGHLLGAQGKTTKYVNAVEHRGSISVVGPGANFQSYHGYLDTRPSLTEKQRLERQGNQFHQPSDLEHVQPDINRPSLPQNSDPLFQTLHVGSREKYMTTQETEELQKKLKEKSLSINAKLGAKKPAFKASNPENQWMYDQDPTRNYSDPMQSPYWKNI